MGVVGTNSQKCNNGCVVYCWMRKREVQSIKLVPIPTLSVRFGIAQPGIGDVPESAALAMRVCSIECLVELVSIAIPLITRRHETRKRKQVAITHSEDTTKNFKREFSTGSLQRCKGKKANATYLK